MKKGRRSHEPFGYRSAVGIMLLNSQGEVFVGRRIDMPGTAAWQMPQGGIASGETAREAVFRELKEEIGTDEVEIIGESRRWLQYDLPAELARSVWGGRYQGQRQKWFIMRFARRDSDINLATDHPGIRRLAMGRTKPAIRPDRHVQATAVCRHIDRVPRALPARGLALGQVR